MHIRLINTDKPTGVVGFLPMEGGNEGGGEGFPAQKTGDQAIKEELVEASGIIQLLSEEDNRLIAIAKDEGKSTQERFDAAQKIENEVAQNEILYDIAMRNTADGKEPWMSSNSFPPAVIKLRIEAAKKIMNESMRKKTLCDMAKAGFLTVDQSLEVLIATNDLELYDNTLSDMAQDIDKKSDARVGFLWEIYDLEKRIHTANNMARDNRQVVFYDDIRSGGIASIKSILTLERATSDIKNLALDTLLAIATDSSVFWKYRLEAAKLIQDNDKIQKAFSSIVTDPILEIGTSDDPDVQEECYINARKTTVKSIKEGFIKDNVIRDIIRYWGNTNCERFDLKNFKFFHNLASGEDLKKELISNIVNNSNLNLDFRQDAVVMVIRNQDERNNSFSWMTFQALNVQEYATLETIRATINLARLMTPDSITIAQKRGFINDQRDCLTKNKKWLLKERKEISNEKQLINSDSLKNEDFTKKRESLLEREKLLEKIGKGLVVEEILLNREEDSLNIREEHELELRDQALQDIAKKWKINGNESIREHINLFEKLYKLVKTQDAKLIVIRDILKNNQHNKEFHDAVRKMIIEKGEEHLLPKSVDTKSARKI